MRWAVFALMASIYLLGASAAPAVVDAKVVFDTTRRLVDEHRLDIARDPLDAGFWYVKHDGRYYSYYPIGNILALAPGYALARALEHVPDAPAALLERLSCHLMPSLLGAALCALVFAWGRREGASDRVALVLTLALGLSTSVGLYARIPYAEVLQALALTWLCERAFALRERPTLSVALGFGVAASLVFASKLAFVVLVPLPLAFVAHGLRARPRLWVGLVLAAAAAFAPLAALALWHNHVKTGAWWGTGYPVTVDNTWFLTHQPLRTSLFGFLFSPGKSLFLYSPPLVLGVLAYPSYLRTRRPQALLLGATVLTVMLANAIARHWEGEWAWGPRYLVPIIPLMMLPAMPWLQGALARGHARLRRLATAGTLGLGVAVQLIGMAMPFWEYTEFVSTRFPLAHGYEAEGRLFPLTTFVPQYSPLIGHVWALRLKWAGVQMIDLATGPFARLQLPVLMPARWIGPPVDWWALDWFGPRGAPVWATAVAALGLGGFALACYRLHAGLTRPPR
jgi:hypothetical protein